MSYRCTDAFIFADKVYPGGFQVADGDPILKTHGGNFARVEEGIAAVETATAEPGEARHTPAKKTPAKKAAPKKTDDKDDDA